MKLFFAILLISTVFYSEISSVFDMSKSETHLVDKSSEGETDKESSENKEEVTKVKFKQESKSWLDDNLLLNNSSSLKWYLSTPYLEIHSPPPDLV